MALEAFLNGQKLKHSQAGQQDATIRFKLDLKEPTDETTNEFSYVWLLQNEREKKKDPLDPFGDDDEGKLAAIARSFEEKYGSKKRKRVIREQDCVNIGMGYDTSDSFVDDSEQYEDYVPPNVDTCHGGFYINTGELEFKQTEDSSDHELPTKIKIKPKIKKQPIHGTPTAILASKKLKLAKQRSTLQKKKLSGLPSSRVRAVLPKALMNSFASQSSVSQQGSSSSTGLTHTLSKDVMSETEDIASDVAANVVMFGSPSKCADDAFQSSGGENREPRPIPILPTGLPSDLLAVLQQLDESISKDQNKAGKLSNKAKGSYDHLLMDIESLCKSVNFRARNAMYDYVAYRFGIARPSLLSRVKRIIKKKEAGTLGGPLQSLKQAIDEAMPAQIAQYELEYQAYLTALASQVASDNKEGDVGTKPIESMDDSVTASQENHSKLKKPRKKFQWTPETRQFLCEVVRLKVEAEQAVRGKVQNGSEIIERFLETDVKPLWPKGWMQRRFLYKLSENAHNSFTGGSQGKKVQLVKKEPSAKPIQGTPKKQLTLQEVGTPPPKPAATSDSNQSSAAALRLVVPALLKASQTSAPVTTAPVTNRGPQIQSIPFSTESPPKMVATASSPTLVKTVISSSSSPKLAKTAAPLPGSASVKPANPVSILKKPTQSMTSPVSILKKTGPSSGSVQQKTLASTITASLQPKIMTTSKKAKFLSTPTSTGLSSVVPQASHISSMTGSMASASSLTNSGSHLTTPTTSSSSSRSPGSGKSVSLSLQSKAVKKVNSQPVIHNEPTAKQPAVRLPTTTSPVISKPPPSPSLQEPSSQNPLSVSVTDTQSLLLSRIQSLLAQQSATNVVSTPLTSAKVASPASASIGQSTSMSNQTQYGKGAPVIPGIGSSQAQPIQSYSPVLGTHVSTSGAAPIGLAHVVISRSVPSQPQLGLAHASAPSSANSTLLPTQVRLAQVPMSVSSSQVSLAQTYASVPGTAVIPGTLGHAYITPVPRSSSSTSETIQPRSILKKPQTTFHSTQVLSEHSYILKATTAPSVITSRGNSNVVDLTRKR